MMKAAGIVFILVSAVTMGFRLAQGLRKRCSLIRQLQSVIQVLKNEITFGAVPLPQAFAKVAASADGQVSALFGKVSGSMEQRCWVTPMSAMKQALEEVPEWNREDRLCSILLELCAKLGQYDTDSQRQGIDLAMIQLEDERRTAEQERSIKSRTYKTLGICAGLAVSILLL